MEVFLELSAPPCGIFELSGPPFLSAGHPLDVRWTEAVHPLDLVGSRNNLRTTRGPRGLVLEHVVVPSGLRLQAEVQRKGAKGKSEALSGTRRGIHNALWSSLIAPK